MIGIILIYGLGALSIYLNNIPLAIFVLALSLSPEMQGRTRL